MSRIELLGRQNACPVVRIGFNMRLAYRQLALEDNGRQIKVRFAAVPEAPADGAVESVANPDLPGLGVEKVEFEYRASGPVLTLRLGAPVAVAVRQGADPTGVSLRFAPDGAPAGCAETVRIDNATPQFQTADLRADATSAPVVDLLPNAAIRAVLDQKSEPDLVKVAALSPDTGSEAEKIEKLFFDAREAIMAKDNERAIRLLTKLVVLPANRRSQEAQEMLGLARERNGQLAHARAEYETYLLKYPGGDGAERVRQRLQALATAEMEPFEKLRKAKNAEAARAELARMERRQAARTAEARSKSSDTSSQNGADGRETPKEQEDPAAYKREFSGSVSTTYYGNWQATRFEELESPRKNEDEEIIQNALSTNLNFVGSAENAANAFRVRFSGSHTADFLDNDYLRFRVSTAYAEYESKEANVLVRLGRQRRSDDGILGRFDGAYLGWQVSDAVKLNLAAGSPVESSKYQPFKDGRWFVGGGAEISGLFPGAKLSLYGIEQRVGSYVDRRAIGAQFRYDGEDLWLHAEADYDVYFNALNFAKIGGRWMFADRSTLSGSIDYAGSPGLKLSNALTGQTATTLEELEATYALGFIKELAMDRTSRSWSANLSYSRPLSPVWQISGDVSAYYTLGNPASGGVPAIDPRGLEIYTSASLSGNNVWKERDSLSLSLRYANAASADLYMADAYYRFPVTEAFRLKPRLRGGFREFKTSPGQEYFLMPSLNGDYRLAKNTFLEGEVGDRLRYRTTPTTLGITNEVYLFLGLRKDF